MKRISSLATVALGWLIMAVFSCSKVAEIESTDDKNLNWNSSTAVGGSRTASYGCGPYIHYPDDLGWPTDCPDDGQACCLYKNSVSAAALADFETAVEGGASAIAAYFTTGGYQDFWPNIDEEYFADVAAAVRSGQIKAVSTGDEYNYTYVFGPDGAPFSMLGNGPPRGWVITIPVDSVVN